MGLRSLGSRGCYPDPLVEVGPIILDPKQTTLRMGRKFERLEFSVFGRSGQEGFGDGTWLASQRHLDVDTRNRWTREIRNQKLMAARRTLPSESYRDQNLTLEQRQRFLFS